MCETLLEVKNVSISFDQYGRGLKRFRSEPIKELNLKIKRGEIVAIVGASGSGKSLLDLSSWLGADEIGRASCRERVSSPV